MLKGRRHGLPHKLLWGALGFPGPPTVARPGSGAGPRCCLGDPHPGVASACLKTARIGGTIRLRKHFLRKTLPADPARREGVLGNMALRHPLPLRCAKETRLCLQAGLPWVSGLGGGNNQHAPRRR